MLDAPKRWRSPEELVTLGYERSHVVMMNEAHNGMKRSVRCRRVGRRILPAAHDAGVRHLAMEALEPDFALEANERRAVPEYPEYAGYLGQPEMRDFIQAALDLGWTLVPYEADFDRAPPGLVNLSMEKTNWREREQAGNLVTALETLPEGSKLFVWCGNSHHAKVSDSGWRPMGVCFVALAGFEHFAIDQTVGVQFDGDTFLSERFAGFAAEIGSAAGFLKEDAPADMPDFCVDAYLFSDENELT